jgi:hypothetical protein
VPIAPLLCAGPDLARDFVNNVWTCVLLQWRLVVKFAPRGPSRPAWRAARVPSMVMVVLVLSSCDVNNKDRGRAKQSSRSRGITKESRTEDD